MTDAVLRDIIKPLIEEIESLHKRIKALEDSAAAVKDLNV